MCYHGTDVPSIVGREIYIGNQQNYKTIGNG